jgi:hypothetical protein
VKFSVKLILAVLVLCVAACAGSLFKSKAAPPTIYMLSVMPSCRHAVMPSSAVDGGSGGSTGCAPAADCSAAGLPGTSGAEIPVDPAVLKPRARTGLESDRIAVLYPDRRPTYSGSVRGECTAGGH